MNIMISLVPKEHVKNIWDTVEPMLDRACEYSRGRAHVVQTMYDLFKGEQHLWIAFDNDDPEKKIVGAATTKVIGYPGEDNLGRNLLSILLCGGDNGEEWVFKLEETLDKFARDLDLDGMEITGRDGWLRLMSGRGYEKTMIVIEKDFRNGQGRRHQ